MRKHNSSQTPAAPTASPLEHSALRASPNGTREHAARLAPRFRDDFFRDGPGGLTVSSLGVGTYLGEPDDADDERYVDAIARALEAGINLVDTAINYRCQRSERAVGAALERVLSAGHVRREEIVVCSKGGYVPLDGAPPTTREAYRAYLKREFFDPGILTPDDVVSGGHSLEPAFLRWSIERSRRNLGVRTIDVYYLHNPEHQAPLFAPASFRERMRAAFMVLEGAVSRGEIGVYGCATWAGLVAPPESRNHLSLQELVAMAREIAGEGHHFRVVQMPLSLAMPEAIRTPTQPLGEHGLVPALRAASALGLAVTASAPLMQSQLTHDLPDTVRDLFPSFRTDAQRALAFVRSLPGVTAALVGMKDVAHLAENLEGC